MTKKITVIGAGFSGLAAASFLGNKGYDVTLLEKNSSIGGRCRALHTNGYMFDMGPSWYWMPDVFERYFNQFGHTASDFYELKRLDPSYRVFFENETLDVPANLESIYDVFESIEKGSATQLKKFLKEAEYKYKVGIQELVYMPSKSFTEFIDRRVLSSIFKINLLQPISKDIRKKFKDQRLRQLLEFPVLFLGAKPEKTPGLYSMMNYADMALGTWYPIGGMVEISKALGKVAEENNVKIVCNEEVICVEKSEKSIKTILTRSKQYKSDGVIAAADYQHVESELLNGSANYSKKYWDKKTFAPSCLLYYVGVNKKIKKLLHHNLFFDADFSKHASAIYDKPEWPSHPLFYVCAPSVTDPKVAPEGHENLFILIPVSTDLEENETILDNYFDLVIERIEKHTGEKIKEHIDYKKSFSRKNFIEEYHSFKGNAYGLANTLGQTAFLKPKIYNKKLNNLFYAGQLTVPGPGMPPALISGELAANELNNYLKK